MQEALIKSLGYGRKKTYEIKAQQLINLARNSGGLEEVLYTEIGNGNSAASQGKLFPNVDGIKFLTHHGGCGGARQDATTLCGLLAG